MEYETKVCDEFRRYHEAPESSVFTAGQTRTRHGLLYITHQCKPTSQSFSKAFTTNASGILARGGVTADSQLVFPVVKEWCQQWGTHLPVELSLGGMIEFTCFLPPHARPSPLDSFGEKILNALVDGKAEEVAALVAQATSSSVEINFTVTPSLGLSIKSIADVAARTKEWTEECKSHPSVLVKVSQYERIVTNVWFFSPS